MALVFMKNKGSTGERLIRILALGLVFALVAWAFWRNNDRTIRMLNMRGTIWDETGALTDKDKEFIISFATGLKDQFGMSFKVQIRKTDLEIPSLDGKTMFIGLVPSRKIAVAAFPAMMDRALGKKFTAYLDQEHFKSYWAGNDWVLGLKNALVQVWERLTALETGKELPPAPETKPQPSATIHSQPEEGVPASIPSISEPVRTEPDNPAPVPAPEPEPDHSRGALNS